MKSFIVAVALLASMSAVANDRLGDPDASQVIITGQRDLTPFEKSQPGSLTIIDPKTGEAKLALTPQGDVVLGEGATIDHSEVKPYAGIQAPFFVVIRVQGKKYVMPVYEYVE